MRSMPARGSLGKDNSNSQQAFEALTRHNVESISEIERAAHSGRGIGERMADRFATTVGSWAFIIIQSALLGVWVMLNLLAWTRHWDPYPFILLNLALSFQAAYASPIIMMSQNRQSRVLERRHQLDLQINMLAEQENTEMLRLLRSICQRLDVPLPDRSAVEALQQPTQPDRVIRQIADAEAASGQNETARGSVPEP